MKEIKKVGDMINLLIKEETAFIGNDIVYLPDFERTFNLLFRNKSYTNLEIAYCEQFSNPILRYASTWAAKEASYKTIKQYAPDLSLFWKKIEIQRNKTAGRPSVKVKDLDIGSKIKLTISHDGDYIWAIALLNL